MKSWIKQKIRYFLLLPYYKSCSTLPLQRFIEIVATKNYNLLKKGKSIFTSDSLSLEVWSDILLEYSELDKNAEVANNWDKVIALRQLQNSYTTIKAMIRLLHIITPSDAKHGNTANQTIEELKLMGYNIDTTNSEKYAESLKKADNKSNSLVTLIRMKNNEIKGESEESNIDFDQIIAMLQLHFHDIKETITVKRYIACKNLIKSRSKEKSKAK
jgi:hypothetical protein